VANGILRRPNDLDYLKFTSNKFVATDLQKGKSVDKIVIDQMPEGKLTNYIFKGTPDLKFIDQSNAWGFDQPSFANGASYADLDNDGDLDLVVNNINEPAGIYQNNTSRQLKNNYLSLQLRTKGNNKFSYGAKAVIKTKGGLSINYVSATRGFESSSSSVLHFGLGNNSVVDTLQITWPDGSMQNLVNVKANQRLTIQQTTVTNTKSLLPDSTSFYPLFKDYTDSIRLEYKHEENRFVDFNMQPLIPHEVSTQGPKLAVADINGDDLDDFFVCGARGQSGKLFQQTIMGSFLSTNENLFTVDALCEDVNAVFFDADGDKDADLYVVSGGNQITGNDSSLLDRLYLNDGKGRFSKTSLPLVYENKSVAVPADFDHDGDLDLFVGGRVVAGQYGKIPQSFLLLNNGKAQFTVAPDNICPGLKNIGMVTSAVWTDIDRDGWSDLIIAGEWMPITVYKNEKSRLRNATREYGLEHTTGLWTTISSADIDNDGYEDLLVGNWGKNSKLQTSEKFPLKMYVGDIDGNGIIEQILCVAKDGAYYTFLGKEEIERLIPSVIRKKFLDYKTMAGKTVEEVLEDRLSRLESLSVNTLSSLMIKNEKGKLIISELPGTVQWSPVFCFITGDFNKDRKTDILSAGNFYGVLPYEGRYDASNGNVLLSTNSSFQSLYPSQSGLLLADEIRDVKKIRTKNHSELYIFAKNNKSLLFHIN
jgi:enediyne biosynthesis protein E4